MKTELTVNFSNPQLIRQSDNTDRVTATIQLVYKQKSQDFTFTAPIGLLEADELRWYLERYYTWPVGLFKKRAEGIEANFPQWGKQLLSAITSEASAQTIFHQWLNQPSKSEHLLSLNVQAKNNTASFIAASHLLSFPWELLHYGNHYLLSQQPAIQIRRNIPTVNSTKPIQIKDDKIRILAISPRPSQAGWFDHRASIKPLVEAVASLGNQFELVRIQPTFSALQQALHQAKTAGKPFHILHFDGHGVFDTEVGKGALCFEHELDNDKILPQCTKLIYADELAQLLTKHHIPLVFLEACQTAQTDIDPNASVATALLQAGISSVIAMTHNVLIETARRFVSQFYQQLALGQSISTAVMAGQKILMQFTDRINILGAGKLHLQDWFVPVLYQQTDSQLIQNSQSIKPTDSIQILSLGDLLETPNHHFIGRSPELFQLERLLQKQQYAVIQGMGGVGKTTIAVELARWLVQSQQFDCCAFISLEEYAHDRAVLDVLGRQLVDKNYSVAEYSDLQQAIQPVQQVLKNQSCLLVLDNMESLLADSDNIQPVLQLANELVSDNKTRLIFTSRESLPAPFNHQEQQVILSELSEEDAKQLIMNVMAQQGLELKRDDQGETPEEVNALITAVNGHARALVLLARELSIQGVVATTENLQEIMLKLDKEHKGDRENSLFASLELSLQRLSPKFRELIKGLAVFYDGGDIPAIAYVLEIDLNTVAKQLATALVEVGLAKYDDYSYLCFDPALPNYLILQLTEQQKQDYQLRWIQVMGQLVYMLIDEQSKNIEMSYKLTQLELPNLIAFSYKLDYLVQINQFESNILIDIVTRIEMLLMNINYPQELITLINIRQKTEQQLNNGSHAQFQSESISIEHLISQDQLQQAYERGCLLLQQAKCMGDTPYAKEEFYSGTALYLLGRILRKEGKATEALPYLQQAIQHFKRLKSEGVVYALMAEQGDCLLNLGKLEQAREVYQQALKQAEMTNDTRVVANIKAQLATVYLSQQDYTLALEGYKDALALFELLGEPIRIARSYHQIGMVYKEMSRFEEAETVFIYSLAIKVKQKNHSGECASLLELAGLYDDWGRLEQAVAYYRQIIKIAIKLNDFRYELRARTNLAYTLIKLNYLDEARHELLCTVEYNKSYGHAGEPWKTWHILNILEQAAGNTKDAYNAQQKAIYTFLAYRHDGGENHDFLGRFGLRVLKAIQQNNTEEIQQTIEQLITSTNELFDNIDKLQDLERQLGQEYQLPKEQELSIRQNKIYWDHLQAILNGDRNPALAEDNEMDYQRVVELKILLEQLQKTGH